jgi:hypothetical protein
MSEPNAQIEQWRVDAAQQWRDQLLANAADFAKLPASDQRQIASAIVADARSTYRSKMIFGVICERQWPNFEWDRKYKNMAYKSFRRSDSKAAENWVLVAIKQGYHITVRFWCPCLSHGSYRVPTDEWWEERGLAHE